MTERETDFEQQMLVFAQRQAKATESILTLLILWLVLSVVAGFLIAMQF